MKKFNMLFCAALICGIYAIFGIIGIGCPLKFFTGISCGGCGMTRAWRCMLSLDFKGAFYYHPLAVLPLVYAVIFALKKRMSKKCFNAVTNVFIAVFLVVYIVRLLNPNDTVVVCNLSESFVFKIIKLCCNKF